MYNVEKVKFKMNDRVMKFAELQVTQIKNNKDYYVSLCEAEWSLFKDYIKEPNRILELGCGIGRMSVFINMMLKNDPRFYLADFDGTSNKIKYGWNPYESTYNDLSLTSQFCEDNGLNNFELINLSGDDINNLSDIDLVMSFLSVGFHYPIKSYLDVLGRISSDDAIYIFGVRRGKYSEYDFDNFSTVKIINNGLLNTKEDILFLKK